MTRRALAALRRRVALVRGDHGMTLMEVVVSLSITAVLMSIFTAGMLTVHETTDRSLSMASAQSQLNVAFLRLDRQIRYAASISTASTVPDPSNRYYVEYLTTNTGAAICTELRLDETMHLLQTRDWTQGIPYASIAWRTLASDVTTNPTATRPFSPPVDSTSSFQRLRVSLAGVPDVKANRSLSATDVTFTALNSLGSTSTDVCTEGRTIA